MLKNFIGSTCLSNLALITDVSILEVPKQRQKVVLILETEAHQTKKALSDLAGVDVQCHTNAPYQIFTLVKNWLSTATQSQYHGPQRIADAFDQCMQIFILLRKPSAVLIATLNS